MGTRGIQDWDTPIPKVLRDGDRDTPIPGGSRTGIPPFPRSWGVSLKPLRGLGTGFQLCFLPNSHPDFPGLFSPLPALCNSRIYRFLFLLPNSPEIPDNPGLFSHLQVLWNSRLFRFIFLLPKNSRLSRLIFSPPSFLPDFPALFSSPFPSRLPRFIFSPPTSLAFPSFQLYFLPPKFWAIPDIPSQFFLLPNPHPEFPGLFSHLPLLWHSQLSRFIFLLPNILTDVPGWFSHLPVFCNSRFSRFIFSPPSFLPDFPCLVFPNSHPDFPGLFSHFPILCNSKFSRFIFLPSNSHPDFPGLYSHLPILQKFQTFQVYFLTSQFSFRLSMFVFFPVPIQTSQVYFVSSQFSGIPKFPASFSSHFFSRVSRFVFSPPSSLEFQTFQVCFLTSQFSRNSRHSRLIFSPPNSLQFQTFQVYFLPSHFSGIPNFPDSFPFN
ncbi:uncharacterized protein LOC127463772 isoform X3 [Manacus candei]|uniref:uncharacterized protein LOC127463772 isoform X3 n=1 Tax=Manacus candei TaxID=415023 RepID=UPI002227DD3B|nr:uncharacterized protein LOC127463772 isoform X3 [Manacus candei]